VIAGDTKQSRLLRGPRLFAMTLVRASVVYGGVFYFLPAFFSPRADSARFGGLRFSAPASAGAAFAAGLFSRLARNASMRSITWAPPSGGASATAISWPSTFFWIAA